MGYIRNNVKTAITGVKEGYMEKNLFLEAILHGSPIPESSSNNYFSAMGDLGYTVSHPVKFVKAGFIAGRDLFDMLRKYLEIRKQ